MTGGMRFMIRLVWNSCSSNTYTYNMQVLSLNGQVPFVVTTQSSSTQRRGGLRSKATAMRPDQVIPAENKGENKPHSKNSPSRRTADSKHDHPRGLPVIKESNPKTTLADR